MQHEGHRVEELRGRVKEYQMGRKSQNNWQLLLLIWLGQPNIKLEIKLYIFRIVNLSLKFLFYS